MKLFSILFGGIVAGLLIIVGEALLNLAILADEWAAIFIRLSLPEPTAAVAAQGVLKLLLLGVFSVWLAVAFRPAAVAPLRAGMISGLVVWFLVWAWVQWGMLLAGYVSPVIAAITVVWGLIELPLAVAAGTWLQWRMSRPSGGEG